MAGKIVKVATYFLLQCIKIIQAGKNLVLSLAVASLNYEKKI